MSAHPTVSLPPVPLEETGDSERSRGDRLGVIASILCAFHCAATPFILLASPSFGKIWSHPASHWLVALFVVPLAIVMLVKGFRQHRRKWVIASGVLGVALILAGAAAPSFESSINTPPDPEVASVAATSASDTAETSASGNASDLACEECTASEGDAESTTECALSASSGSDGEVQTAATSEGEPSDAACVDLCCPSLQTAEDGTWSLHVPMASILTTLGGLFLIVTHIGNLCCCSACRKEPATA